MRLFVGLIAAALLASAAHAIPGERVRLNACKLMVERAEASPAASPAPDSAELQKCRQMIKEWTLRDSRMSVDENGKPIK
ncbi:MAG: hypothetical protein JO141_27895 [Bradyrhizobium sp.]|nr:hypothetical protein [Bradyrhizobium sp.]